MIRREAAEEICQVGRLLWERHLIGAWEGNISVRLENGDILCTPAGKNKGFLVPDDLVVVDIDGMNVESGRPSSEIQLHLECYAIRKDCRAVVHAHPPFATAFALAGISIPNDLLPEAAVLLGPVALVPFAMPGTTEMRAAIRPFLAGHDAFLLANHGATTIAPSVFDAFAMMDTLERVAAVIARAQMIDKPQPLTQEVCAALAELRARAKMS